MASIINFAKPIPSRIGEHIKDAVDSTGSTLKLVLLSGFYDGH